MFQIVLFGLSLVGHAEVPTKIPPDKERGEELYKAFCIGCHGVQALGMGPTAVSLGYEPAQVALAGKNYSEDFQAAIQIIQQGQGFMPAYDQQIDKHESKRILIWLESLDPEKGAPLPEVKDSEEEEANGSEDSNEKPETDSNIETNSDQKIEIKDSEAPPTGTIPPEQP